MPPRMLNPKADRDLEMICLRCLQKPADLRYAMPRPLWPTTWKRTSTTKASRPAAAASRQIIAGLLRETHHAAGAGKLGPVVDVAQPGPLVRACCC